MKSVNKGFYLWQKALILTIILNSDTSQEDTTTDTETQQFCTDWFLNLHIYFHENLILTSKS